MKQRFISRDLGPRLLKAADTFPALVLTGPRQTGKSTLLRKLFPKARIIDFDDPAMIIAARKDPRDLLASSKRLILDEIQNIPEILPYIKLAIDENRHTNGRFLLTGSQVFPLMEGISESLAGRVALFELLGFSWKELPGKKLHSPLSSFKQLYRGFLPVPAIQPVNTNDYYTGYVNTYLERDIRRIQSVADLTQFRTFLQLVAARTGTLLNLSNIGRDCGVSQPTARKWLSLLETSRIVYLLRPWTRNLSKRVIKAPKVYFTDPGLVAWLMRYPDPETLLSGPMNGAMFECMIVSDLLKTSFNKGLRLELYHYRDSNGNEVDLILDYGRHQIPVELKLGRTIQGIWADAFSRIPDSLQKQGGYVLSHASEEVSLGHGLRAMPWWQFDPSGIPFPAEKK